MRKIIIPLVAFALAAGCQQRTETTTVTDSTGTVQEKTTTVSATMPTIDTAATAEAKQDVKDAAHKVGEAAKDAAHATGTALEKAGKKIQEKTAKKP